MTETGFHQVLAGYCDDVKPVINNLEEFSIIDQAVKFFELVSGCVLHRDLN